MTAARVLAIAGAKGGIGKTTTAAALAAVFAARGRRVTLLDLDPQASATLGLGQTPSADPWHERPRALELDGIPTGALQLLPAGRALALAGAERVRALLDVAGAARDVLVLDCPPGLTPLTVSALQAADLVLVPLEPSPLALPGLADVAAIVASLSAPPRLRVVLTRVHPRRILTDDVRNRVREMYPGALYRSEIPEDVRAAEAPGFGLPVPVYAPRSRAAVAYEALAAAVTRDIHTTTKAGA